MAELNITIKLKKTLEVLEAVFSSPKYGHNEDDVIRRKLRMQGIRTVYVGQQHPFQLKDDIAPVEHNEAASALRASLVLKEKAFDDRWIYNYAAGYSGSWKTMDAWADEMVDSLKESKTEKEAAMIVCGKVGNQGLKITLIQEQVEYHYDCLLNHTKLKHLGE